MAINGLCKVDIKTWDNFDQLQISATLECPWAAGPERKRALANEIKGREGLLLQVCHMSGRCDQSDQSDCLPMKLEQSNCLLRGDFV